MSTFRTPLYFSVIKIEKEARKQMISLANLQKQAAASKLEEVKQSIQILVQIFDIPQSVYDTK